MKNRFILLIDFSEYSANLVHYACDWSKQVNAEMLLVHQTLVVAPALTDNDTRMKIAKHARHEALQKLKAFAKELIPPTVKVSFSVSEIHLRLKLPTLLSKRYNNLIFVGIKGTGLLKKIFLGSVAIQVIDSTNNIIVAMPKTITRYSHEKIFVGISEKHPLDILKLNKFLNYIDRENTSITFFHLAKSDELKDIREHLKDLAALFAERFDTNFIIYEGSNPFADIKRMINNKKVDMLIVQKGSRLFTDQIFRRFLVNELVYEGQTPLIVLP